LTKKKKIPELIWLEDESSTTEDFILVESRGKKRQNKKSVKFSLESSKLKQDQVKLGMLSKKGRKPSDAFSSKNVKSKKKS
jgi:hypothetical protein